VKHVGFGLEAIAKSIQLRLIYTIDENAMLMYDGFGELLVCLEQY